MSFPLRYERKAEAKRINLNLSVTPLVNRFKAQHAELEVIFTRDGSEQGKEACTLALVEDGDFLPTDPENPPTSPPN